MEPVKVFIVDDSPQLAEMLGELLADPGSVDIAGSADGVTSALEGIARSRPDIVIVDLQLKDGNGFELAERLRSRPDTTATGIVFFTNHASPELVRRAEALGAHFLDKSKDHTRLLEIVRAHPPAA